MQIVVSGEVAGVLELLELAQEAGAKRALRLQVGAAFHSELMVPVYERLAQTMDEVAIADPKTPLVAIYSAQVLHSAAEVREALLRQIVSPVRWVEVTQTLVGLGCDTFLELGPGRVLGGLIRQIDPDATLAAADSVEKLQEFVAARS